MGPFIAFLQSLYGRLLRIILGVVLVALGVFLLQGFWAAILIIVGIVPLVAGLTGVVFFAPLFGYTLTGERHAGPTSV
ncbi:MAG TPA: DUF2892 domain-containing protein [Ktedonosporobacter sp.]|jgi:thiol:disulfide interchange protein|nr:DUF2892 domain-containing protein [Ktedonosporobacter sp.]